MSDHSPVIPTRRGAAALNPSAGAHPVTTDLAELEAARRAGERSLSEYPYYLERYGERARLFGLSDGAWIVTLCANSDLAAITAEVKWLAHVLSSRGMPSIMMERHLEFMVEELTAAVPRKAEQYTRLTSSRDALADRRRAVMSDGDLKSLAKAFGDAADPEVMRRVPRFGEILVSAVIDEAGGIARAVASIVEWAESAEGYPQGWTANVETIISAARLKIGGDTAP